MKKLIVLILLAAGGYAAWHFRPAPPAVPGGARPGGKPGDMPPVPVIAGKVERKDIPIYLNGLGNVQGYNTVTVRSRVDGHLIKVAFKEGQDVRAGDVLAEIDPKPFQAALEQALAKKAQDEAQLINAKLDLERNQTLLSQKAIPQQRVDTQKYLVDQLAATVQADEAAIESARVQLGYTTITSPIDGRTGLRLVDEGNVVQANDQNGIVVISQIKPISVLFTLPEKHLPDIQREMGKGKMSVIALGRDNETELGEGELSVVDNQIDISTGTIRLKATFPNEALQLWPGQFVNIRLLLTLRKNGIVVPASVVQRGPENTFAFVIKEDQSVEMRQIKVSQIEGGYALIEDGLKEGERVVVDGQYRLQPGSRVRTSQNSGSKSGGDGHKLAEQERPKATASASTKPSSDTGKN